MCVSEIGFGAWAIAGHSYGPVTRPEAVRALSCAEDLGLSSWTPGACASESVLDDFLRGRRDRWIVPDDYSKQPEGMIQRNLSFAAWVWSTTRFIGRRAR
jgi:hypothetical protein